MNGKTLDQLNASDHMLLKVEAGGIKDLYRCSLKTCGWEGYCHSQNRARVLHDAFAKKGIPFEPPYKRSNRILAKVFEKPKNTIRVREQKTCEHRGCTNTFYPRHSKKKYCLDHSY
jgi:hypothetical protein